MMPSLYTPRMWSNGKAEDEGRDVSHGHMIIVAQILILDTFHNANLTARENYKGSGHVKTQNLAQTILDKALNRPLLYQPAPDL